MGYEMEPFMDSIKENKRYKARMNTIALALINSVHYSSVRILTVIFLTAVVVQFIGHKIDHTRTPV